MRDYEEYYAYFDLDNDEWLEKICSDKNCEYCRNRPDKPSEVKR